MPLKKGLAPSVVSANISELVHSGKRKDQAIAIAMGNAKRKKTLDRKG